ncbi:hypothetical protein PRIPAC_77426 [Pristionchus pacificus]|uniref:G protein-coupled receptor n=1 Tax=Pristionchus pacificus TaxID=54126 RepID=A0A2A6CPT1_PRIPA|nr:hypothetical protein PRIPAC_77426 [Pristionchus pacificus]|eukprot:PDM80106.1 G protein-coupled receptor [Pristionchus pacificus]
MQSISQQFGMQVPLLIFKDNSKSILQIYHVVFKLLFVLNQSKCEQLTYNSNCKSYQILMILSELRFYGIFISVYTFVNLTMERVFATIFIRNYEVLTGLVSLTNERINAAFKRRLEASNDLYALSMKFQLRENFRAFRLMKQVSIASVFAALSMCTVMYFVIAYHEYRNLSSILGAVFDTLLARPISSTPVKRVVQQATHAATSEIYFKELGQSWERKYDLYRDIK